METNFSPKPFHVDLYDMHMHLDLMPSMLQFCQMSQVSMLNLLAVTTTPKAYEIEAKKLQRFANVHIALGLHPQLIGERYSELSVVERLFDSTSYIGEIGLDFSNQFYYSKEQQIDAFSQIIRWCQRSTGKVLSIHSVRSDKHVLDVLEKYNCTQHNTCILHWFSGSKKQLERAIELGCYFSVNSYILDSPNGRLAIERIPLGLLLLESDAPFLSSIKSVDCLKMCLLKTLHELSQIKGEETVKELMERSQLILSGASFL